METHDWVSLGTLIFTILSVSAGGLWAVFGRLSALKQEIDLEIDAIRTASFVEYKEIRREMNDGWNKAYLEFGEAPKALREKIAQVELFMRDTYLPIKQYERSQDQVLQMLQTLQKSIEDRFHEFEKKLERRLEDK